MRQKRCNLNVACAKSLISGNILGPLACLSKVRLYACSCLEYTRVWALRNIISQLYNLNPMPYYILLYYIIPYYTILHTYMETLGMFTGRAVDLGESWRFGLCSLDFYELCWFWRLSGTDETGTSKQNLCKVNPCACNVKAKAANHPNLPPSLKKGPTKMEQSIFHP